MTNANVFQRLRALTPILLGAMVLAGASLGDATEASAQNRPVSLQSVNYPQHFIRHRNYLGEITPIKSALDKHDGSFRMVKGLYGRGSVSFESVNFPGYYLRHQGYRIKLHKFSSSTLYKKDASFYVRKGLAGGSSFESVNYPRHYLRHCSYHMWIDNNRRGNRACSRSDAVFKKDVSFHIKPAFVR